MSIGTKMRGVGESTYYTKLLRPQLEEVLNKSDYEMEHILGKRKLVVHTDRISDELNESIITLLERESPKINEVERYNHHIEVSWRDIDKYTHCLSCNDMLAVNPDYKNDLTSDGEWVYPLNDYVGGANDPYKALLYNATNLRKINIILPKAKIPAAFVGATDVRGAFAGARWEECTFNFPEVTWADYTFAECDKMRKLTVNAPKLTDLKQFCRYSLSLEEIQLNVGTVSNAKYAFDRTKFNKESALHVFSLLGGSYTSGEHILHIGIHVDHKTDEEVLTAIANAESKGWTLTVQWNGTPTTQAAVSYGLRKQPIYAKLGEMERPDGTTELVLDWGHYITNPEDYQEFSSLEEAREYFGISEEN